MSVQATPLYWPTSLSLLAPMLNRSGRSRITGRIHHKAASEYFQIHVLKQFPKGAFKTSVFRDDWFLVGVTEPTAKHKPPEEVGHGLHLGLTKNLLAKPSGALIVG